MFLKKLGEYGNASTPRKVAGFFGLTGGTFYIYNGQMVEVLMSKEEEVIFWPDVEERKLICQWIAYASGGDWEQVVGMVDGTYIPLECRPSKYGESYFTRKGFYAVHTLVIVDDEGRVHSLVIGFPRSTHDNHVFHRTPVYHQHCQYVLEGEHLFGGFCIYELLHHGSSF